MSLIGKIYRQIEPLIEIFYRTTRQSKTAADPSQWKEQAQKGEFAFHKNDTWRQTEGFLQQTSVLFKSWGFEADEFEGQIVLDVGAGSMLRGKYFKNAKLVALEPMADDVLREIPWTDLQDAWKVFSTPAEQSIPELVGQVDFIFSINVLDHCYNFDEIIANLYTYLKPGARAFLSFDEHYVTNKMHPLILTETICPPIFEKAGFKIEKFNKGFEGQAAEVMKVSTYGHGQTCLNYWLRKP